MSSMYSNLYCCCLCCDLLTMKYELLSSCAAVRTGAAGDLRVRHRRGTRAARRAARGPPDVPKRVSAIAIPRARRRELLPQVHWPLLSLVRTVLCTLEMSIQQSYINYITILNQRRELKDYLLLFYSSHTPSLAYA